MLSVTSVGELRHWASFVIAASTLPITTTFVDQPSGEHYAPLGRPDLHDQLS